MPDPETLYVHVPFCVVKCGYCDFNSYAIEDGAEHDRFLSALDREFANQQIARRVPSVFVGGGTPTYLDAGRFDRLLEIVGNHIDLERCPEVTIEGNPESCEEAKLRAARAAGVNRLSLGVQSFDATSLEFLERRHRAGDVERAVDAARAAGFENLSLDLIYGLPGQTVEQWSSDLDRALSLEPDHLSCYQLTYEPGTRLTKSLGEGQFEPIGEDAEAAMFALTHERLAEVGFQAYEVSNFAGRGGSCRHNLHYWAQGDYLGVGPGAASHRRGWRRTNLKPLEAWCSAVERGLPAAGDAELLTVEQQLGEALWLGLRTLDGADLGRLRDRFGVRAVKRIEPRVDQYLEQDLLQREGERLALQSHALPLADAISEAFLD
ncbi:MAG: radical SAM family heme chaperone HemW [Planctomycetota bacterium]